MRRGDVVKVAAGSGFGGQPRPALVIQADEFAELGTVVALLFTSEISDNPATRPRFEPTEENGLTHPSDLMTDIVVTVRRERVGGVIGRLDEEAMTRVDRALILFLGLAGT